MIKTNFSKLIVLLLLVNSSFTNAQSKIASITGSCGFVLNRNFGGWDIKYEGDQTVAQNITGIINFDSGTMFTLANTVSNFGKSNAVGSQKIDSVPNYISMSSGPFSGSYYLSVVGSSVPSFMIIPVNGGNTFLMSELNSTKTSSTGVCQKI